MMKQPPPLLSPASRNPSLLTLRTTLDDGGGDHLTNTDHALIIAHLYILLPFLHLPLPSRLTLDLRSHRSFARRHLRHSTHILASSSPSSSSSSSRSITGLEALDKRFSTSLPPRHIPFLLVCHRRDVQKLRENFGGGRWNLLGLVVCSDDEEQEDDAGTRAFWDLARQLNLVFSSPSSASFLERLSSRHDRPLLLGQPAPAVIRAANLFYQHPTPAPLRALDVGCGAGRDIAWLAYEHSHFHSHMSASFSESQSQHIRWLVSGIDNLRPALERAQILMQDFGLMTDSEQSDAARGSFGKCEHLLWAEGTRDGKLSALSGPGRGPKKSTAKLDAPSSPASSVVTKQPSAIPLDHSWQHDSHGNLLERYEFLRAFAAQHLPASFPSPTSAETSTFDLLILIRFLPRQLLLCLPAFSHVGTHVVISHFFHADTTTGEQIPPTLGKVRWEYENPPREARLKERDVQGLRDLWSSFSAKGQDDAERQEWVIVQQVIEPIEDGRPVQSTILRRVQ